MKKLLITSLILASVCGSASADWFGTTPDPYERRAELERQRQEGYVNNAIKEAPEWMYKLPISNNAVFATGTAVSYDMAMSDMKAKADAYGKICMTAGGTASQRTKIYKTDNDRVSTDSTEMAMRTTCKEVNLAGVEIKEVKHLAEGNRFRTYVLVVLPTGDANVIKGAEDVRKQKESSKSNQEKAFDELDSLSPKEEIVPTAKSNVVGVVVPETGQAGQLKLLDVDNAEYKAKRDVALQKPGAVIGQTTIQN
jgi:hypothetical protein